MNPVDSLPSNRFRMIPSRSARIDDLCRQILNAKAESSPNIWLSNFTSSDMGQIGKTVSLGVIRGGLNQPSFEFDTCVDCVRESVSEVVGRETILNLRDTRSELK